MRMAMRKTPAGVLRKGDPCPCCGGSLFIDWTAKPGPICRECTTPLRVIGAPRGAAGGVLVICKGGEPFARSRGFNDALRRG